MFIDLIAGARPNFVKIAAILHPFHELPDLRLNYRLVHTGQHYDKRMSGDFFEQLEIPEPHVNLEVGSGTQAEQTAKIMLRYEELIMAEPPAATLVVGDVTSTMACAIVAQKQCIPVAHVEAGIRSGDWTMPEEINRLVTDAITNWFFTTSEIANSELRRTGISDDRIFFVGNTMIDTLLRNRSRFQRPEVFDHLGGKPYLLLTLHRPSNVDDPQQLRSILDSIAASADSTPVLFPVHPRTRQRLEINGIELSAPFVLAEPLPYLEFNYLVERACGIITDSGGITEEATVLGIPCMTLRNSTERPETVELGTNELIGSDVAAIPPAIKRMLSHDWKQGSIPPLWDGKAGPRIVRQMADLLSGSSRKVLSVS
jgi:UDP-N-acetylglucosamine 2-epimerase (non-hydrolysing)